MSHLRVLVTAWRDATPQHHAAIIHRGLVAAIGATILAGRPRPTTVTLVHGDYRRSGNSAGGDHIAAEFGRKAGWAVEAHPAQNHPTEDFGPWPACGPRRNHFMISLGADLLVAFPGPDSRGTRGCVEAAWGRIPVIFTMMLEAPDRTEQG
jgi:hypothetical protein